jgi:hypothetical protein
VPASVPLCSGALSTDGGLWEPIHGNTTASLLPEAFALSSQT